MFFLQKHNCQFDHHSQNSRVSMHFLAFFLRSHTDTIREGNIRNVQLSIAEEAKERIGEPARAKGVHCPNALSVEKLGKSLSFEQASLHVSDSG